MNWDQFIAAVASLRAEPVPLGMMSGIAHDNATSDISGPPTGKPFNNDYASLIAAKVTGDFVWLGLGANKVQADGSGGHPLLLGMRTGYCAGRIEDYGFFFHSGHFHPEVEHAIPFVIDFITRSCAHLAGGPRDEEVDRLSKLRLRFYEKNSTTETYFTNFAELAKIHGRVRVAPATHALSVSDAPKGQIVGYRDGPWGMKIPIYAEPASPSPVPSHAPSHAHGAVASTTLSHTALSLHNGMGLLPPSPATTFVAKPTIAELPADKSAPTMAPIRPLNLGVTPTGQYFAGLKLARAIWMPDGERDNCARCHVVFTFFNRKHHCRKCGDLVCNGCSGHTRKVHMPATAPNEAAVDVTESARVCSMCVKRLDL